jgi:two-component sensor histidine kinase/putative methionine-R-sulfoxide reductase with GAF domain
MVDTSSLESLATQLERRLRNAYDEKSSKVATSGGQALVEAFEQFGSDAASAGISLEDTMSVSVDALQAMFERHGGYGTDPSTMRIAGIALAATARAHDPSGTTTPRRTKTADQALPTQIARLSALHRINRTATANLQLSDMLETTVAVVAEATESDAAAVFLFDEAAGLLTLRAAVGMNPTAIGAATLRIGNGITGRAALEAKTIAAPDAHAHANFIAHPGIGDEIYTSQVSVPILLQGQNRLIGILNINSLTRREFDSDELEFLQTVAGELAISIENARQYSSTDERLRQKVSELGTLQRVSRIVASTLDLNEVIKLITEQAVELLHAEAAAIFRPNYDRTSRNSLDAPVIEYRVGSIRDLVDPEQRDSIVNDVLRTGTTRSTDISFVDGVSRLICLPLRSARETVGALCFRLRSTEDITEDTLGVLQAFSDSAAMAIENAQLYQDAMHSIQTQSALVQEMHHRVRNNLQTVAALLSLQIRSAEDAEWATEIREAVSRIQAIAAVHDLLSDESRLAGTTVDIIARHVAEDAHSTLIPPHLKVKFDLPPSNLTVPSRQATILSLLINELTSNAIHHGFRDRNEGFIRIQSRNENGTAVIEVFNDGQGVPDGFNPAMSSGLGMKITQRLVVSDLRGTFNIRSDEHGTTAEIRFPIAEE